MSAFDLPYTPVTAEQVKGGEEKTGIKLNVVEANVLQATVLFEEVGIPAVTPREICALTGYTLGQVEGALAVLLGLEMVRGHV